MQLTSRMVKIALSSTVTALRDVRARLTPVEADIRPDGRGPYPLDLRAASRAFRPGRDGVVAVAGPDGRRYFNPVSASLYALARHTQAQHSAALHSAALHSAALHAGAQLAGAQLADASVAGFLAQARHLRMAQDASGGWRYPVPVARYRVSPGWYSGMAQGLAASVLLRASDITGERSYLDAAGMAVTLLLRPLAEGGCAHYDETGMPFLEECPSDPPSHILNGAVFALIGLREFEARTGGKAHASAAQRLASHVGRYDLGYWSRYDLHYTTPATVAYHALHISLLDALDTLVGEPAFRHVAGRWRSYLRHPAYRLRAMAGKARFVLGEARA